MPITHITDHADQALLLLLEQYQDKPRLRGLLLSYVNRCQELEDAAWDVIIRRMIENAADAQLDTIGRIVGETRKGRADDLYRIWILARIAINKSHSHASDIITVLRIVEAEPFRYREFYPAAVLIEFTDALAGPPQDLRDIAEQTAAAGVRVDLVYSDTFDAADAFTCCARGDETDNGSTQGFGLRDLSTGGRFSQVVRR